MSAPSPLPAPEPRPWLRAAAWLAFLGPFFFVTYGFANWWTGRLPHVGSVVFGWEKHIPFWPWTIVPYMALDAFYAGSLFLCATRAELNTHARRLLSASVLSVAGFLLFPLRFSFARPATSGLTGLLFNALAGFDKPYNQAPSLHISLVLLVWLVFARHLRGAARWLAHGWFLLIALSVFTTYQHHFIDGVAGAAVGVGATMQLPMDARLASTSARFGFVFSRRGITPEACSSWFLPRLVGPPTALEWFYSGRVFDAQEALDKGLCAPIASLTAVATGFSYASDTARAAASSSALLPISPPLLTPFCMEGPPLEVIDDSSSDMPR